MKKFVLIVAVAALAVAVDSQFASAGRRGGCGGGRGGCGGGGCGGYMGGCGGYMGGCGGYMGGCGYGGGCGMGGCGYGGGCGVGACGYGGGCGYVGGGYGGCATCGGGICAITPVAGAALAQADETEATLVVSLPEDAQLTIDNEQTTSTSAQRVFVTPSLESGKDYQYTLKAQVVRDGKVQTTTQKVTVRAGAVSRVELTIPATGVAQ